MTAVDERRPTGRARPVRAGGWRTFAPVGTRRPAEYFEAEDEFGTVAVGRRADLVLLAANPLDDIGAVRGPAGVMVGGRWIPAAEIEERLTRIARFYGNE